MDHSLITDHFRNKMSCDWSSLPADLINKIGQCVPVPHRPWFRTVCKSWCSTLPAVPIPSPWLLLPADDKSRPSAYTHTLPFRSVESNTTFTCPLPAGLSNVHCVGCQEGWLILSDIYFNLCMLNPLTGHRIELPPFCNSPKFEFVYDEAEDGLSVLSGFRDGRLPEVQAGRVRRFNSGLCYIKKIILARQLGTEDFMAAALFGYGSFAYLKGKDPIWHGTEPLLKGCFTVVRDIALGIGCSFQLLDCYGNLISVWLRGNGAGFKVKLSLQTDRTLKALEGMTMAVDIEGIVYLVLRNGQFIEHPGWKGKFHTKSLRIMKTKHARPVDSDIPFNNSWVPVKDLNGRTLFVGINCGFFLEQEHSPHKKGNCVYLTGIPDKDELFDTGVYDMEKKSFEPICPTNIELNWANLPPVWISPFML